MRVSEIHPWELSVADAKRVQEELAPRVIRADDLGVVGTVCGVDIGVRAGRARAAYVVMSYPELELLEWGSAERPAAFPYVPGLLSFREIPPLLPLLERMKAEADVFMADGQGIAHPRRFGLACHLGLILGKPSIGCAKAPLLGTFEEPGTERGSWSVVRDGGEEVGAALRTKRSVKPVFVSIGHRVSLATSIEITLRCSRGYRIPEPLRRAHGVASGAERTGG